MMVLNNVSPAGPNALATGTATTSTNSSTAASAGFASQLADAIENYLSQSGNGSQFEIDVQNNQASGGGYTITVKDQSESSASSATASTGSVGTNLMDAVPLKASTSTTAPAVVTTPATAPPPASAAVDKSKMTPDDAYWAEQPPAVQALRNMTEEERGPASLQLAQAGYTIDVPIMAWGWDPLTTMVERQNYGYTWVPSALQSPCPLPPGLSYPGLANYDPNKPPAGSIPVTTAFAQGTNMQDVFIDPATIAASIAASPGAPPSSSNAVTTQASA